jgi:hypothetical protein
MPWQKVQTGFLNIDKIYFIEILEPSDETFEVRYYLSPKISPKEMIIDFYKTMETAEEAVNKLIGTK